MRTNLAVIRAFLPNFSLFRADLSPGRKVRGGSTLWRLEQHPQNQYIVRHHGAPDILPKAGPLGLAFLLVIRPVTGMVGLMGSNTPRPYQAAIATLGIRGIGSFYYLAHWLNQGLFNIAHGQALWAVSVVYEAVMP